MTAVFLFGPLGDPALRQVVLGRAAPDEPAQWPAHEARWSAGAGMADPVARPRGVIAGHVLRDLTPEEMARLDHFAAVAGQARIAITVAAAHGPVTTETYAPTNPAGPPGAVFDRETWRRDWAEIARSAAKEIMALFGREAPADAAQRHKTILGRAQARRNAGRWSRGRGPGTNLSAYAVTLDGHGYSFPGFFSLEEYRLRHPALDGNGDVAARRMVFSVGEASSVLPYDPHRDRVLLVEQFRAGAYAQGDRSPWLLEPVAGLVDAGETAESSARREAMEEAGIAMGAMHFIARYYPSPGGVAQVLASYLGIADLPDDLPRKGGLDTESEDIAIHLLAYSDLQAMLEAGALSNAPLIISAEWLGRHRAKLRADAAAGTGGAA